MGELVKALEKHHKDNVYPFHMPGHKRQADWIINPYEYDITEISHFDDLHNPKEILKNLQEGKDLINLLRYLVQDATLYTAESLAMMVRF